MFVFISPSVSLYKIFASPAVSSLTLKIVISVLSSNHSRILDLVGTVVLRIFLCRVGFTTVWILLASADPSPAVVLGRCLSPAT